MAGGVTRRLDELGRVVVPKEIRSQMRLFEGNLVEFCGIEGDKLIIKKYSPLAGISEIVIVVSKILSQQLQRPVFVVADDKLISCYRLDKNKIDLLAFDFTQRTQSTAKIIVDETEQTLNAYPLIAGGDLFGNLCVISNEIDEVAAMLINFAVQVLGAYFENY